MKLINSLCRFYRRLHYPCSLPEDVASALGIELCGNLSCEEFVSLLINPATSPKKLAKFMSREEAEAAFSTALRKEKFPSHSLFSYYFNSGWMGFYLKFDEQSRLRRVYLQHKKLHQAEGLELEIFEA